MTFVNRLARLSAILVIALVSACSTKEVIVEGTFPAPLVDPVPVTVGILFTDDFRNHELVDDASGRGEISWNVKTGAAQVDFWSTLLPAFFQHVVFIESYDDLTTYDVDAVLIPEVVDVQYAIPFYTKVKVYEIWMRYRLSLVEPEQLIDAENMSISLENAEAFAQWPLTAYGKTPKANMEFEVDAVNSAAVMALRDAGANFVTSFLAVPGVLRWVENPGEPQ